jgi:chromosome segregation ATPase
MRVTDEQAREMTTMRWVSPDGDCCVGPAGVAADLLDARRELEECREHMAATQPGMDDLLERNRELQRERDEARAKLARYEAVVEAARRWRELRESSSTDAKVLVVGAAGDLHEAIRALDGAA